MNAELLCLVGLGIAVLCVISASLSRPRPPDQFIIINPPVERYYSDGMGCLFWLLLLIVLVLFLLVTGQMQFGAVGTLIVLLVTGQMPNIPY